MASTPAEVILFNRTFARASGFVAVAMLVALAGCETLSPNQLEPEAAVLPLPEPAAPGTIDLAARALDEDRLDDAGQLLDRVLIAEPENWRALLLLAELHLASGAPTRAEPIFQSLTDKADVDARALQGLGITLILQGKQDSGVDRLRQAVEMDSGLWRAWNALGYYHDSNSDWEASAKSYSKAIESNPDSMMIYNNRGFSMLMQKRLEEAVADFNRALRIDPDFDIAQENLRLALAWQGKYVHAMAGTENRDMARILNNVGFIALMRGDYDNAESYLLRAMEADPRYNDTAARNLTYLKQVRELAKAESEASAN